MKKRITDYIPAFVREPLLKFWREKMNGFYRLSLWTLFILWGIGTLIPSVKNGVGEYGGADADSMALVEQNGPEEVLADERLMADAPVETVTDADTAKEALEKVAETENNVAESVKVAQQDDAKDAASQTDDRSESNEKSQASVATPTKGVFAHAGDRHYHPIGHVSSYEDAFPDIQETQILAAQKWGVRPPRDRKDAERRKKDLVYVGGSPYVHLDPSMKNSIPYLVPRASNLLNRIGRNFFDSCYVKGIPLHKIIVSSVLRSEADVARLSAKNGNVSTQSCHRFGTTFDICWTRFHTVRNPEGPARRTVRDDTLKFVLSEVLRDLREQGVCYVKHERKQSCFHVTVR